MSVLSDSKQLIIIALILIIVMRETYSQINEVSISDVVKESTKKAIDTRKTLGFDHIYCISLHSRPDRRMKMEAQMRNLNLEIEFWNATTSDSYLYQLFVNHKSYGHNLNAGQFSLFASTYLLFVDAVTKGYKNILVLEDDAEFDLDIHAKWNDIKSRFDKTKKQWKMLLLGHCLSSGDDFIPGLQIFRHGYCTHAYALTSDVIHDFLKKNKYASQPIDIQLFPFLLLGYPNQAFMVVPELIRQAEKNDANPSSISYTPNV